MDPHVDPLADQPAVHRVDVVLHVNQAASIHAHVQAFGTLQPRRQRPQQGQLLRQTPLPARVPLPRQLLQEPVVERPIRKLPTATQQQGLIHQILEVPMRRLDVTVLVRLPWLDLLHRQIVVLHQPRIALREFLGVRQIVHGAGQPIRAMPPRHTPELTQRVLQPIAQTLETLREAQRHRLPVRVGQDEVIHHMLERLTGDGHAQAAQVREIRGTQPTRLMHLAEEHLLGRALRRPPNPDSPLERPQLAVVEKARVLALQPGEQRIGAQRGRVLEQHLDSRPHLGERIVASSPGARRTRVTGQAFHVAITPSRLPIHAGLDGGRRQRRTTTVQAAE